MHDIYQGLLNLPQIMNAEGLALLNPIPQAPGLVGVEDQHPLVLQNFNNKWVVAIIALQLEDFVSAVTPVQQRGFIKGWYIFDNLWQAFGS